MQLPITIRNSAFFFVTTRLLPAGLCLVLLHTNPEGRNNDQSTTNETRNGGHCPPDHSFYDEGENKLSVLLLVSY
jgi:hypothetical protein